MSAFRFHYRLQVRVRDCDLSGHVKNALYFTFDEQGAAVARGKAAIVGCDYSTSNPVTVPDRCRARIEEYEGRNPSRP